MSQASASAFDAHNTTRQADRSNSGVCGPAVDALDSSPMIRLLGRDTGAQFALCRLLTLNQLVALHRSCRSWRRWLDDGSLSGSSLLLDLAAPRPHPSLLSCRWVRRFVHRLRLTIDLRPAYTEESYDRLDPIVSLLTCFPRIHALQLSIHGWSEMHGLPRLVPLCASLRTLVVNSRSDTMDDIGLMQLVKAMSSMHALTSLYISCVQRTLVTMDFRSFAALPALRSFSAVSTDEHFRPSRTQVNYLASCKSLTELQCGLLLPDYDALEEAQDDAEDLDSEDDNEQAAMSATLATIHCRQIAHGIAALVEGRKQSGAVPLRKLDLCSSTITHEAWAHVSQLSCVESLGRFCLGTDLTAEDWLLLGRFQSLQSMHLELCGLDSRELDHARFLMDSFIAALARCHALETLSVDGRFVMLTKHVATLATLPRLRSLQLFTVFLESLAPLTDAPALADLQLSRCSAVDRTARLCPRSLVPQLSHLTSLLIYDHSCLSDEQAAPLNALLFARCPQLRPAAFRHNQTSVRLPKTTQSQRPETVLRI